MEGTSSLFRYDKSTIASIMLPYSVVLIVAWSALLVIFWVLGIPLGWQSSYVYP